MSIGRDPREWIMEIGSVVVGLYGVLAGLLRTDYVLAGVSGLLLIVILNHYRMRKNFEISVRDRH